MEKPFNTVTPETAEEFKKSNKHEYLLSKTSLIYLTEKKTGAENIFLMTIVPDLSYLISTKFDPFKKMSYLKRDNKFDGMIYYHNMRGEFVNGWLYKDGKVVSTVQALSNEPDFELGTFRSGGCVLNYTVTIVEECWYQKKESGEIWNMNCITYIEKVSSFMVCDDQGGNGGFIVEGGTPTPTPASVAPKATKIFRNANLTIENWKKLEEMLNKIMKDCLGSGLYNSLLSVLEGKTLAFEFSTNPYGFNYGNGSISLDMSFESNRLFHEMWHALQAYKETATSYTNSTLNQEFEAWYAQYLYISKLPEYKQGSTWYAWYNQTKRGISIRQIDTYFNNKGNLLFGESAFWSYLYELSQPGSDFRIDGYESILQYRYDSSRTAAYNFRNLSNLLKNC